MEVIILLIGASLIIAVLFLLIFLWAVKSGQYEDTYTPSIRAIFDDEQITNHNSKPNN